MPGGEGGVRRKNQQRPAQTFAPALAGNKMTISAIDESQRKAAKVAGLAYLLTLAIVVVANFGIYFRLVVVGNTAGTVRNIIANERLFRLNIACDLIYAAGIVVLLTALYAILKPVNKSLALLAGLFRLAYASMWVVIALNLLGVLRLVSGAEVVGAFEADRVQALAKGYLGAGSDAYTVGLLFWGLGSAICGCLLYKSRYIPRALAGWGVISSVWCATCALAVITVPNFAKAVDPNWFDMPMVLFEIATSLWLLFKGLRPPGIAEPDKASYQAQAGAV